MVKLSQRFFSPILLIFLFILYINQSGSILNVNSTKLASSNSDNILLSDFTSNTTLKSYKDLEKVSEDGTYVFHSEEAFDGYNFFQFRNFSKKEYNFRITDMEGKIIREFPGNNTFSYGHMINSTTILLYTTGGTYFWNIETGDYHRFPLGSHHDISYNPRTKTFMTMKESKVYQGQYAYRYDIIREVNMVGEIIWELNTSSFVPFEWWSGEYDGAVRDITHSNSLFWDIEEDMIYLLCRNLNTFFKINHSSGEIVWGLGEFGNFALLDDKGNRRQNLFSHAHALEKVDNDTFILFDNDYLNQTDPQNCRSQLLEITINETSMIAKTSWFWRASPRYYSAYWGDADRLPNGNRFGTFGTKSHIDTDIGPRLVEVNESGHIVWEMYYKGSTLGIYKAERFKLNPILNSPEDVIIQKNEIYRLSWQTWYNARTRLKMNGSYTLYQNEQVIDAGDIIFNQFWLPTTLTFELDSFKLGEYNFTLVVFDEGGHFVKDSVNVTVKYLIYREGPNQIELGQENVKIRWIGANIPSITGKIFVNNTLTKTFAWNGSEEIFDLDSLQPGKHNISFQLFDLEKLDFYDQFWITVHSPSPPKITDAPEDFWVWSNQTNVTLMWKARDISPKTYSIYVDDLLYETDAWNGSDIIFNYNLPSEGEVSITLFLYDVLGNSVEDIVIIEVRTLPTTKANFSVIGLLLGLGIILKKKRSKFN
ncbi:MAG: aryl-sulfate sulfotransferase [Candidatus Heimdallarchaeota archaeon]|nr:MAG: aryl-sulfate sulfotransferase [Candidatus Heimdallarchaeota archaeon]